ncbi:Calx-beta domain-containing protein [Paenibacillus sp. SI8]|uniref:Calx-beta domain-containing protein n=1 Tax=unclassified Paenibacillus TaxID=185978 RepID=UPI00346608C7
MKKLLSTIKRNQTQKVIASTLAAMLILIPHTAHVVHADPASDVISLESSSYSILESGGSIYLTVTRSNPSDKEVSVRYDTGDGSAISGFDYAMQSR